MATSSDIFLVVTVREDVLLAKARDAAKHLTIPPTQQRIIQLQKSIVPRLSNLVLGGQLL